jgi:hypothetical protein
MADRFVASAGDIRRALRAFNLHAARDENRSRALNLLTSTTFWVYDPDAEQFGPSKFVGLARMEFGAYETERIGVSGAETRRAIERALDDVFISRPAWRSRLREWGKGLLGEAGFGGADASKWKFTSLRSKSASGADLAVADEEVQAFPEGALSYAMHRKRDRSAALVSAKKRNALLKTGSLACQACGFNFADRYGEIGDGFIECHHTAPISELKPNAVTRLADVALCLLELPSNDSSQKTLAHA